MDQLPTILVVDDSPTTLLTLGSILENLYDVRAVTSGEEALDLLPEIQPDLILLDVMMPGMDGFEVCKRLRALPQYAQLPIVFSTALNTIEDETRCFEAGGSDFVTKPFNAVTLRSRVQTHIALKRLRDQLAAHLAST